MGANLNYVIPSVGDAGPGWATKVVDAFTKIEQASKVSANTRSGCDPTGTTDSSPAIAAALAAAPAGSAIQLAPGTYLISQMHVFGDGYALQCGGGGQIFSTVGGVVFRCTAAGAGIRIEGTGGPSCGFRVDGNNIATTPFQEGSVAHPGSGRLFIDVSVVNSAQDDWTILAAQNSKHIACATSNAARDGLYISGSAGGLSFDRCEFAASLPTTGRYDVRIDCLVDGTSTIGVSYPLFIEFQHCFFERETTGGTSQVYIANGSAGGGPTSIHFDQCNHVAAASALGPCIDISGAAVVTFTAPSITCSASAGMRVADTCQVTLRNPSFSGAVGGTTNAIVLSSTTCSLQVEGDMRKDLGSWGSFFGGPGVPDAQVRTRSKTTLEITRQAAGDSAIIIGYNPAVGISMTDFANGLRWYYNGFTPDTSFGPSTIGVGGGVATNKGMGFWGHAAPPSQPTVTGSRGGNAALASLLTALAATGLIVDGTTA